jgi:acetyl esterase/lipase
VKRLAVTFLSLVCRPSSRQLLDVFFPPPSAFRHAQIMVHIHGGGWQRGDRKADFYGAPFMGRAYSKRGYVTLLPSYRLDRHPAAAEDVARALRFAADNATRWGLRADCGILLSGHSAGAHLISLVLLDERYLRAVGLSRQRVMGVAAISGIYLLANPMTNSPEALLPPLEESDATGGALEAVERETAAAALAAASSPLSPGSSSSALSATAALEGAREAKAAAAACQYNCPISSIKTSLFNWIYVRPVFGEAKVGATPHVVCLLARHDDGSLWCRTQDALLDASPLYHLQRLSLPSTGYSLLPPFCLVNATTDFGLEKGAEAFLQELRRRGSAASMHQVVPSTTPASGMLCVGAAPL